MDDISMKLHLKFDAISQLNWNNFDSRVHSSVILLKLQFQITFPDAKKFSQTIFLLILLHHFLIFIVKQRDNDDDERCFVERFLIFFN